jgi:Glycosyltransferase like family
MENEPIKSPSLDTTSVGELNATEGVAAKWSVISAVNDEQVLQSCLLNSPGIQTASAVFLQRGFKSAPAAYNAAIQKATTDLLVFVHQDVYLPEGWIDTVNKAIAILSQHDPNWGVLGVWGAVDQFTHPVGYLWWTGHYGWERPFEGAKEVVALDEVVLIFRKSSGLTFDEHLPGYHLYGTDICLEARRGGKKNYAIPAFCIHNTHIGGLLPLQFWKCYLFMRRKWRKMLPIITPCTQITSSCWPVLRWNLIYARNVLLGRQKKLPRAADPAEIYHELTARGLVRTKMVQPHKLAHTTKDTALPVESTAGRSAKI